MECGERHDRGVGEQGHAMAVGDVGKALDVCHIKLWVRDDLEEQTACMVIDGSLHFLEIARVDETGLYTEAAERVAKERHGVAKEVFGRYDVDILSGEGCQRIRDGSHARIERRDAQCSRPLLDATLKILCRGVGDAAVGMFHGAAGESIARSFGGVEAIGRTVVDREIESTISVRLDEWRL